jgi:hypothetical protein
MRIASLFGAVAVMLLAGACSNLTGDMTIAQWCGEDPGRADTDICKQHQDTMTLGDRIASVLGIANRAQSTADQAMARNVVCVTRTLNRTRTGTCDPGYVLAGCTQTRYTTRAGGMAILRSVNDTECRYNSQVLEVQVRCCAMGPNPPPATMVRDTPPPAPEAPQPAPVS